MHEALEGLGQRGVQLDALRLRAFPFTEGALKFIKQHQTVFVVEQNRDAQLRTLLLAEAGIAPEKLVSVLYYGGLPMTAEFLIDSVLQHAQPGERIIATGAAS